MGGTLDAGVVRSDQHIQQPYLILGPVGDLGHQGFEILLNAVVILIGGYDAVGFLRDATIINSRHFVRTHYYVRSSCSITLSGERAFQCLEASPLEELLNFGHQVLGLNRLSNILRNFKWKRLPQGLREASQC